jgi:hypothetical protein
MIIITYIMGHTLTITAETLPAIHTHLKNRGKPAQLAPQTSPRLANRQLKFFLHVLRNQSYKEVLKWQQATLQMSQNKDSTWLAAFCVMLVLAMVLEEVQRTIQIQADAKPRSSSVPPTKPNWKLATLASASIPASHCSSVCSSTNTATTHGCQRSVSVHTPHCCETRPGTNSVGI